MYLHFYVYAYLRNDGTPYYIGKGSGDRAWSKGKGEVYPPLDLSNIVIVESNLTDIGALAIERFLIKWYGRKDNNTGILRNKSDGGDGASGAKRSEAHKKAMSKKMQGRKTPWTKVTLPNGETYSSIKDAIIHTGYSRDKLKRWIVSGDSNDLLNKSHRPANPKGGKPVPITTPDGKTYSSLAEATTSTGITPNKIKEWIKNGGECPPRYVITPDGKMHRSLSDAATKYRSSRSKIAYWIQHGGNTPPNRVPFPESWYNARKNTSSTKIANFGKTKLDNS